ncbi:MAG: hypothetical protein IT374_18055 [Polyangiaceae bacterium]|nr:hypothetical protein [Polyangiaceae bacterium]
MCQEIVPACAPGACASGEYCRDLDYNDAPVGLCAARAGLGAPCDYGFAGSCVDGAYCSAAGGTRRCAPIAGAGEKCEHAAGSCGPDGYCDALGTCAAIIPAGGACPSTDACAAGSFCNEAKLCEARRPAGGACRPSGYVCKSGACRARSLECQKGLRCAPSGPTGACFAAYDCGVGAGVDCCVGPDNTGACKIDLTCQAPLGVCAP